MAINLRCYTKYTVSELQPKLDVFLKNYPIVFPRHYVLYKSRELGPFDKEIANEFGLNPKSYFYIAVNNKLLEISIEAMAKMIKDDLGKDNVIVLLDGEELI